MRMRCPSSVRQFSASCIFSARSDHDRLCGMYECRMTFLSSCRTRRTLLNPLRGVSSGTVSSGSVFPGFSSSPSVVSFSLKAEGAGCSVPESGPLPRVCSLRLISSRMRCISLSRGNGVLRFIHSVISSTGHGVFSPVLHFLFHTPEHVLEREVVLDFRAQPSLLPPAVLFFR